MPEALQKAINSIGKTVSAAVNTINNIDQQAAKIPEQTRAMATNAIESAGQHATPAPPPIVLPPTRMPTSNDQRAAQRQSVVDQLQRRGRASTILTNPDTLG